MKISGLDDLERRLKALGQVAGERIMQKALTKGAKVIADNARANLSAEGINPTQKIRTVKNRKLRGREFGVKVQNTKKFWPAHFIEKGTKPHLIVTHAKKVLGHFGVFFGRVIHHPGVRARHFMERAFDASKERSVDAFKKALHDEIVKASKK